MWLRRRVAVCLVAAGAFARAGASPASAQQTCQGGGCPPEDNTIVSMDAASIATVDVSGDSICKAFNGRGAFPCPNRDQEQFNWATSDTHGTDFCSAGPEGVYSHAERIECARGSAVVSANPNHARSGADMLTDFVDQAVAIRDYISTQPAPRYVPVLLGHNDVCGGTVLKYHASCPRGSDQDPTNYCRTRPAAFERELRKGLDVLITIPDTRIGVAAMVRVSQLCNLGSKLSCQTFTSCRDLWAAAAYTGWIFGSDNGICGSLTVNCSDRRLIDAYLTAKAYRDVTERVAAEYALVAPGAPSPVVTVAGETVGGAVKASGVSVLYSDVAWRFRFGPAHLNCCDCFHPSPAGQNAASRVLFEGLTCTPSQPCCHDTGDPLTDARCAEVDTDGTFYPGFFN
jgi:hypothetical protein